MKLRPYQQSGLDRVDAALKSGSHRVLAVAPTGSGKGTMAAHLLAQTSKRERALFLVHRREIVIDVAKRIRALVATDVGVVLPGQTVNRGARIQVASVQSLMRSRTIPDADLIVPDEAHHYAADEWGAVLSNRRYSSARMVGFTATPQRADGRALGDVFDTLVVVATYSELIASKHIVQCQVLRPDHHLGIDIAQDPLDAYKRYANGTPAMVYVRRVSEAKTLTARFVKAGFVAAVVHAKTGKAERDETLRRFADGRVTVVVNVYALTEGVDVPRVSTIVLARTCDHASTYVQIVGRGLRPSQGKRAALLLDLTGVSHKHGLPTDDRDYSLEGAGMGPAMPEREGVERVDRVVSVLGLDLEPAGHADVSTVVDDRRIRWDVMAAEIVAGRLTVSDAAKKYLAEFGERSPWIARLPDSVKAGELARMRKLHIRMAPLMYQEMFG